MEQISPKNFTDIHVHIKDAEKRTVDVQGSLLFPGALNASEEHRQLLEELAALCHGKGRADFMIDLHGVFFRVRRDELAVDGTWYRMRRMADTPPQLEKLKFRLPSAVEEALLEPRLSQGGLVMVVGPTGAGKTHTAAATVVSRLHLFGGVAYTVEEPVEMPLNGRHGDGYCTQSEVAGEGTADWVESLRGVLRSQPVGTAVMLYVGEIRDAEAARIMLRAATNGFLVICTSFGADVITSIADLCSLLGPENQQTFAQVMRVVVHQQLQPDRLSIESLCSEGPNSRVAAIIRNGQLNQLRDEITFQRNAMMRGAAKPAAGGASRPAALVP